ncbi:hypothetical protein B0H17DRAFT_718467 [Mycena rosella]|uniref:Uncharacterized protein n=1 Tax=Mycena rosella TaxID=1033263 RepID=A0AAD7DA10_MYCRO|nr:hypothetical protein B0H17DRAFT_718467 [Mycena rosella]
MSAATPQLVRRFRCTPPARERPPRASCVARHSSAARRVFRPRTPTFNLPYFLAARAAARRIVPRVRHPRSSPAASAQLQSIQGPGPLPPRTRTRPRVSPARPLVSPGAQPAVACAVSRDIWFPHVCSCRGPTSPAPRAPRTLRTAHAPHTLSTLPRRSARSSSAQPAAACAGSRDMWFCVCSCRGPYTLRPARASRPRPRERAMRSPRWARDRGRRAACPARGAATDDVKN